MKKQYVRNGYREPGVESFSKFVGKSIRKGRLPPFDLMLRREHRLVSTATRRFDKDRR